MRIYIVDAFTKRAYKGNQAAVCLLDKEANDEWMQAVAGEMQLSETAFLLKRDHDYLLRWFTPKQEVDLCGHATLASSHILWDEGYEDGEQIRFQTLSGVLTTTRNGSLIDMDFPLEPPDNCELPLSLVEALDVPVIRAAKNRLDYFVEVENVHTLTGLLPDFAAIKQLAARGVVVTCRSDDAAYDFLSRCFYPALGVNEDPVTGSAHCGLAPFWRNKLNKDEFHALQKSERSGELLLKVNGDRVTLSGQAVTTMKGKLF